MQKSFLATLLFIGFSTLNIVSAQINLEMALEKVFNAYSEVKYLTFDIKYIYVTDTVESNFKNIGLNGTYTLAGKKAKYTIGDIECMQNDSFLISVNNTEQFIIVSDPSPDAGSQVPIRSMIDSIALNYYQHYNIINSIDSTLGTISFVRADSVAQYDQVLITYDTSTMLLNSIEYDYEENDLWEPEDPDLDEQILTHKKKLKVNFLNYRIDNFSDQIYQESNYIWFENGTCKPVDKYKNYKVYYSKSSIKKNTKSTAN